MGKKTDFPAPPDEPHFRGYRVLGGGVIVKGPGGRFLDPRYDLWNHSPDGFEWGYAGSGPAQLALAIVACAGADEHWAVALHQKFKRDFVVKLNRFCWNLTLAEVRAWIVANMIGGDANEPVFTAPPKSDE
jgi:Family of unknown function (DUF6166)